MPDTKLAGQSHTVLVSLQTALRPEQWFTTGGEKTETRRCSNSTPALEEDSCVGWEPPSHSPEGVSKVAQGRIGQLEARVELRTY